MIRNNSVNPFQFVRYIYEQLYQIQYESINEYTLLIDYVECRYHSLFNKLEHTICQFHVLSFEHFNRNEMITFTLNMYHIMILYSFFKIGIPITEYNQMHFYLNIKIMMNHHISFTIRDWIDGILVEFLKSS